MSVMIEPGELCIYAPDAGCQRAVWASGKRHVGHLSVMLAMLAMGFKSAARFVTFPTCIYNLFFFRSEQKPIADMTDNRTVAPFPRADIRTDRRAKNIANTALIANRSQ